MQVSLSSKTILPQDKPPGDDLKGAKTLPPPQDIHCVQKPSLWDRTRNPKPQPGDLELVNFTNISINSFTI